MDRDPLRAVVLVQPGPHADRRLAACWDHCHRRGHHIVAVVTTWEEAAKLVLAGHADIIVVHSPAELPPDRVPRVEVAGQAPSSAGRARRL